MILIKQNLGDFMEWFKQHADTIVIVTSFVLCFWHLNERITSIEKDVAIIKTVLVMKQIMPNELCKNVEQEKK
jgi:hypothetical protein